MNQNPYCQRALIQRKSDGGRKSAKGGESGPKKARYLVRGGEKGGFWGKG